MFHRKFSFLSSTYHSFYFIWFSVSGLQVEQSPLNGRFSVLTKLSPDYLPGIRRSICISKSQRILCVTFFWTDSCFRICHRVVWSNFHLLHNSQWITFPNQSCIVLYSFCARLLLWDRLSLSTNLYALFCCILSIWALIWLARIICESFSQKVLADGCSRESQWQQVSSSLLDTSQYSGRSQESYCLDGLYSSSNFQFLQSRYQYFGDCTGHTYDNYNHRYFYVL